MLIIDAHEDIAFNALALKRDYTQSVAATRAHEGTRAEDIATLGLPDALAAGVGIVFGTLYVAPASAAHLGLPVYSTAEEAYAQAHEQLAVYRNLAQHAQITLLETQADLDGVQASW